MHKIINFITSLTILLIITVNSLVYGAEDKSRVQLTDYRYESAARLIGGYTLLNYFKPYPWYDEETGKKVGVHYSTALKLPSAVIKPDGTEMFKPGKYYIQYQLRFMGAIMNANMDNTLLYPQIGTCDRYIVFDIDTNKAGLMDENGNVVLDFIYDDIQYISDAFLIAVREIDGVSQTVIINKKTSKEIYSSEGSDTDIYSIYDKKYYWSENNDRICHISSTGSFLDDTLIYYYDVFDTEGNIILSGQVAREDLNSLDSSWAYDYAGSLTGDKFHPVDMTKKGADNFGWYYSYIRRLLNLGDGVNEPNNYYDCEYSVSDDMADTSYIIESKEVGEKTYYAVFKELGENETEADYRPSDVPSDRAKESVDKLTAEGLLFNEANCRYSDNISRRDFAFLAVRVFCKAKGYEVEDYIKENNIDLDYDTFTDTEDTYSLLAKKIGILSGTSDTTFSPERGISEKEAQTMLFNTAAHLGLKPTSKMAEYTETERPALSREQAYVNLCRIYEAAISQ